VIGKFGFGSLSANQFMALALGNTVDTYTLDRSYEAMAFSRGTHSMHSGGASEAMQSMQERTLNVLNAL
jgi:hypothetical protein